MYAFSFLLKIPISFRINRFTLYLVEMILGRMENIEWKTECKTVFFTIWKRKENRESEKLRRKFSLLGPQISSSQIRRKNLRKKLMKSTLSIMPSHLPSFKTFSPTHLMPFAHNHFFASSLLFTFRAHPTSTGFLLLFFSFQCDLLFQRPQVLWKPKKCRLAWQLLDMLGMLFHPLTFSLLQPNRPLVPN